MTQLWKITDWDFVLGANNNKIPQITFNATLDFISRSNLNNDDIFVTIHDTNCQSYNNKNFKAIVDKSTKILNEKGKLIGFSESQPCPPDLSSSLVLYTLTLPNVCFEDETKGGSISFMNDRVTKKEKGEEEKEEKGEEEKEEKEEKTNGETNGDENSLPVIPLALIGGVLLTGAILTIFLIRRK